VLLTDGCLTGEDAALRRVAALVARKAPPEKVFAAVTAEAGRLLQAHQATMCRYIPGGAIVVAAWGKAGAAFPVGSRWSLGGRNAPTLVLQTGKPARTDDSADVSDRITEAPPAAMACGRWSVRQSAWKAVCGASCSWVGHMSGAQQHRHQRFGDASSCQSVTLPRHLQRALGRRSARIATA
jgi:hypothetical protein